MPIMTNALCISRHHDCIAMLKRTLYSNAAEMPCRFDTATAYDAVFHLIFQLCSENIGIHRKDCHSMMCEIAKLKDFRPVSLLKACAISRSSQVRTYTL